MEGYVYEVIDVTNDEVYWPIGMFASLEEAEKEILEADVALSEHAEEFEVIAIVKHALNKFRYGGQRVKEIKREEYYKEDTDEYLWRVVPE